MDGPMMRQKSPPGVPCAHRKQDEVPTRLAQTILVSSLLLSIWALYSALTYVVFRPPNADALVAAALASALLWAVGIPGILRRFGRARLVGHLLALSLVSTTSVMAWLSGGFDAPMLAWTAMVPVLGMIIAGPRAAFAYALLCMMQLVTFYVLDHIVNVDAELKLLALWNSLALMTAVFSLSLSYEGEKTRAVRMLEESIEGLHAAQMQAEQANQAKGEFLANISHEIRTPMTAILGYADVLAELGDLRKAPVDRLRAIEAIKRSGAHLLDVINDILDVSKMEAGCLEVNEQKVSPIYMIADVRSLMAGRASAKGLRLETESRGLVPEYIRTDPRLLRQILLNLVGNGVKFTDEGFVKLRVYVLEGTHQPGLAFEVMDSGIGIASEDTARLFQPFTQADGSITRRYGGTGLGLTICDRFSRLLGGRIEVETRPEGGSTFRLILPIAVVDGARMIDPGPDGIRHEEPSGLPTSEPLPTLAARILVAEDCPDNRQLVGLLLRRHSADVTFAEDGRAAVELALDAWEDGHPFDLILMDMQMPILDGYSATRYLRDRGYSEPIIALTANVMSTDREKCLASGCDDYARKPIERGPLLCTIMRHLESRKDATSSGQPG